MRRRDSIILFACLLIAAGLLVGAGKQLDYVNAQREEMDLTINPVLENAPPSLAFATVAMGAFRGLVVDILWMRADKLKEEGQFFDARQLAEWITTLQPRFGAVWEFHAWNMAYNISVAIPASQPEERFRWVRNGYELLRDKGIPLNPSFTASWLESFSTRWAVFRTIATNTTNSGWRKCWGRCCVPKTTACSARTMRILRL